MPETGHVGIWLFEQPQATVSRRIADRAVEVRIFGPG